MTVDWDRFGNAVKVFMIGAIVSASLVSLGCGGDDPSSLAGTIDVVKRGRPQTVAKKFVPTKAPVKKGRG